VIATAGATTAERPAAGATGAGATGAGGAADPGGAPGDPAAGDPTTGGPDGSGAPGGSRGLLRRARALASQPRLPRPSTPFLLRVGMALSLLPVAFFVTAIQLGVARNDSTVRTVGSDATQGITIAQAIKLNLAELDEIVVRDLLEPVELGPSGFPTDYSAKRDELHENLVAAALGSSSGAAYEQPLVNIDYVLAHYHTLVKDAFAAADRADPDEAALLYRRAHEVMEGTLLPEADFVDKANTYVLNDTYTRQEARSSSTVQLILVSWLVLLLFLVLVQVLVTRRFRRLVNVGLAAATAVAAVTGLFVLQRLDSSSTHLSTAREQAFDSVHVLARARSTIVAARQSQAQLLLDPEAPAAQTGFQEQIDQLFRVQSNSDVASLARSGDVPDGAGGYLATVARVETEVNEDAGGGEREDTARRALIAFGEFLSADATMRQLVTAGDTEAATGLFRDGEAFTELTSAIDEAQTRDQATFDQHAGAAEDASADVDGVATLAAGGVLGLALLGLYQRLREFGT
jgi:hypothetical protein